MTGSKADAPRHALWWLPNALTATRIALTPVVMALILMDREDVGALCAWSAFAAFAAAAALDFLDGYLARRWGVESDLGRMLDPIADKVLVAGSLIALVAVGAVGGLAVFAAAAIIFRDLFVSGLREFAASTGRALPVSRAAKWKTAAELVAVGAFLLASAWSFSAFPATLAPLLIHGAAALSLWTGFQYAQPAFRREPVSR